MYLVTGSAGFIGFHLSLFLLKKQKNVIGIDNINNYYSKKIKIDRLKILKKYPNFEFYKIDLKNKKKLSKIINKYKKKIKIVIHLAGQAGVRYSIINPITYVENNITTFINLLELFKKKSKNTLIIYASSSSIYGEKGSRKSISSIIQNNPISIYSASKLTMELISKVYNHIYKINFIGVRFFSVYGPWGRPDMFYFKFLKKIKLKQRINIYNFGKHHRSFTYIDDVVLNLSKIINKFSKKNTNICDVYNIGNPKSISLMKLITTIEKKLKTKCKKKFIKKQLGDLTFTKSNIYREKKAFGHITNTSLSDGVNNLINWYEDYYK